MNKLYIPVERPMRNPINDGFLEGIAPHNKGKTMKYRFSKTKRRSLKNLVKGCGSWHKIGVDPNRKSVIAIKDGKLCGVLSSIQDAGRVISVNLTLISCICNEKPGRHRVGGFKWFFENDATWCDLILKNDG